MKTNFSSHGYKLVCHSAWMVLISAWISHAYADLKVSNVRAAQRLGTNPGDAKLVDIYYDLTDDGIGTAKPQSISVRISGDDGVTFVIPAKSLSGSGFGAEQLAGKDKLITWNAGVDWNNKISPNIRFEVTTDDFVLIPAGTFQMGDNFAEGWEVERPVHTVNVSAFYIGKYEVTHSLWLDVANWANANGYDISFGAGKGADHPVQSISWYDVVKWCNARSQRDGLTPCYSLSGAVYRTGSSDGVVCNWSANGYRLPSEAEWEKAARGGLSGKRFPWGDTISHSQANYYSRSRHTYDLSGAVNNWHPSYTAGDFPYSSPVGSFAPNGYRLYDMAGNSLEWVWDWDAIGRNYYESSPTVDPRGPSSGETRMLRGGDWGNYAEYCRVACRNYSFPRIAGTFFGFRLARSSVP